tara:strand:+ start:961 stop:2310 length:1350 start_codon:yes stop_codon:yes gene_type:complete
MGGGLLQLVAYGAQDVYLTSNPQITFFKVVYRRHTNFSMESIQQTFNGEFNFGRRVTAQISRNGDLISNMWLEVDLPFIKYNMGVNFDGNTNNDNTNNLDLVGTDYERYVNYVGLRMIDNVELEIGGQRIDKQYGEWMYIWNELALDHGKKEGYQKMVGADTDMTSFKNNKLYIPLEFWFCKNPGLALPLIALQYHEVKVNITIRDVKDCVYKGTSFKEGSGAFSASEYPSITSGSLWVDYIFLDTDERRRFAQLSHEYLIEQVQYTGSENLQKGNSSIPIRLNFNHPVKELIWTLRLYDQPKNQWYNYSYNRSDGTNNEFLLDGTTNQDDEYYYNNLNGVNPSGKNTIQTALLQFNGNDRFAAREGNYFSMVQPYQHHNNIPTNQGINVYSFALKPEEHQCSGSANFSRLDTTILWVNGVDKGEVNVYAKNYNVLRILSGMGGLAYSN